MTVDPKPKLQSPVMLGLFGPLPFAAGVGYAYDNGLSTLNLFVVAGLTIICLAAVAFILVWQKKLNARRLYLVIKPRQIETANGDIFLRRVLVGRSPDRVSGKTG